MACCPREFSLFERRHHCRRCGDIFCGAHCSHYIRLDQNSNFNLMGSASRVCDRCNGEYVRLVNRCKKNLSQEIHRPTANRVHRRDSDYGGSSGEESSENVTSLYKQSRTEEHEGSIQFQKRPLAQSNLPVSDPPPDWSWSTF